MWGWPPSTVDDMSREDFRMCKAIVDQTLTSEGGVQRRGT